MATLLIVETGEGVANANSYVDLTYARAYASSVGRPLPSDDDAATALLLGAMPYLESRLWKGRRVDPLQALSWPREGVTFNQETYPNNAVPDAIKKAQVTGGLMIGDGTDLLPTVSGQFITKEKVGPIETEYSAEYLATLDGQSIFTAIDIFLQPFLVGADGGGYKITPFGF